MHTEIYIQPLEPRHVGDHLFGRLAAAHPEGERTKVAVRDWSCRLPLCSPVAAHCLHLLSEEGLSIVAAGASPGDGEVAIALFHIYDERDLDQADFLVISSLPDASAIRGSDGLMQLLEAAPCHDMSYARATIVSDDLKRAIEASTLKGANFRPMRLLEQNDESTSSAMTWELRPTTTMPRLLNSRIAAYGRPSHEPDRSVVIVESLSDVETPGNLAEWLSTARYSNPQLRYRRSEVLRVQPGDFAISLEWIGTNATESDRYLIVSQHFRRLCCRRVACVGFEPVAIVD